MKKKGCIRGGKNKVMKNNRLILSYNSDFEVQDEAKIYFGRDKNIFRRREFLRKLQTILRILAALNIIIFIIKNI